MKNIILFFDKIIKFLSLVPIRVLRQYKIYILKDAHFIELKRWSSDKGDETLRLKYPNLNKKSIVFDLGGYKGDFAEKINKKYGCKVYLFEPHPEFYKICADRFQSNEKVITLNYGLSDKDGVYKLSDSKDGSSFLNPKHQNKKGLECKVKEIFKVLDELNISNIDLMKINIEGGEYPLLLHMATKKKLAFVNEYQVQFHNFINEALSMRDKITKELSVTHEKTWCYTFVWENWKKK